MAECVTQNQSVEKLLAVLRTNRKQTGKKPLKSRLKKQKKSKEKSSAKENQRLRSNEEEEEQEDKGVENDALDDALNDPYRVRLPQFCHVSHEEFNQSSRCALHSSYRFDLPQLEQVSRHAFWSDRIVNPRVHYAHDPAILFDALVLASLPESGARRAATQIPYDKLLITENNDTLRIIDQICKDEALRQQCKQHAHEFLMSLMATANASDFLPTALKEKLDAVRHLSNQLDYDRAEEQEEAVNSEESEEGDEAMAK